MSPTLALLSAVALFPVQDPATPTTVQTDPRLTKAVTVRTKMAAIGDVLAQFGTKTGVKLSVAPAVRDLKASVFVKDQPAGQTLAYLASTLDLVWEAEGDAFRLVPDSRVAGFERTYLLQEDRLLRKQAEDAINGFMRSASAPSFDMARRQQPELSLESFALGVAFRRLNASGWNAFWAGRPVTAPMLGGRRTGSSGRVNNSGEGDSQTRTVGRVSAQYDPVSGNLLFGGSAAIAGIGPSKSNPKDESALKKLPFTERVVAWEKRDDSAKIFETSFTGSAPAGPWQKGQLSLADILENAHELTGLPIVADAFRVAVSPSRGAPTVKGWLNSLQQANRFAVRTENGFAMIRHREYWRRRRAEVAERVFAPLEAKELPSLDAYARFATTLTAYQALPFRSSQVLSKVDLQPLQTGMPALRFYGSLGGLTAIALRGRPIQFGQMNATQQGLFVDALAGFATWGARPSGRAMQLSPDMDAGQLGFLMSTTEVNTGNGSPFGTPTLSAGTRLLFGISEQDAVIYTVTSQPESRR